MKKLFAFTMCCFVASLVFGQRNPVTSFGKVRNGTKLLKKSGPVSYIPDQGYFRQQMPTLTTKSLQDLNFIEDIRTQVDLRKFEEDDLSPAQVRKGLLFDLASQTLGKIQDPDGPVFSPEKHISKTEYADYALGISRYIQGGDGEPYFLKSAEELRALMMGDAFGEDAKHMIFLEPIYHSNGNVYLKLRRSFTAFDRDTEKFYRFKTGSYINFDNPFNSKESPFNYMSGRENFISTWRSSPENMERYEALRNTAFQSEILINNPLPMDVLHKLFLISNQAEIFGESLVTKQTEIKGGYTVVPLTSVTSSLLAQRGDTFVSIPKNSYLKFNPHTNQYWNKLDVVRKNQLSEKAYTLSDIFEKSKGARHLRTKFFELEYREGRFFAHPKRNYEILLKNEDGSLSVLTVNDIIEIEPQDARHLGGRILGTSSYTTNVLSLLPQNVALPFPPDVVIEYAVLKTIPTPLHEWERWAFRGSNGLIDFSSRAKDTTENSRFLKTVPGGLTKLPEGALQKSAVQTEKPVTLEQKPTFKPDPDIETPFGQDPEPNDLPGYVIQAIGHAD